MTKLFPHAIYQLASMTTTCCMFTCISVQLSVTVCQRKYK